MSNLQPNCCLEFDFRKVDQHAGGKWLIHDTKRRKDNQLQSLKLPCKSILKSHVLLVTNATHTTGNRYGTTFTEDPFYPFSNADYFGYSFDPK